VDIVIEHVGEATWAEKHARARPGRPGRDVRGDDRRERRHRPDALFAKELSILGSYMGTKRELIDAARPFFDGRLKPVIDRTFPLADAVNARRRLEASSQFGKIVLGVP
jgi:NADPH:quinone reductase-like Zn-dependent oxidoreductase